MAMRIRERFQPPAEMQTEAPVYVLHLRRETLEERVAQFVQRWNRLEPALMEAWEREFAKLPIEHRTLSFCELLVGVLLPLSRKACLREQEEIQGAIEELTELLQTALGGQEDVQEFIKNFIRCKAGVERAALIDRMREAQERAVLVARRLDETDRELQAQVQQEREAREALAGRMQQELDGMWDQLEAADHVFAKIHEDVQRMNERYKDLQRRLIELRKKGER